MNTKNFDYELSDYSILMENKSIMRMKDTFTIKLNSINKVFNGIHKIEITKDYNKCKKHLHIYSNNLNLRAEAIDYEALKNHINHEIKPKSVIIHTR